jgi:hypothetical protein
VTAGSAGFGAAGILSGYARLVGDSAIEFKSGEITSLAAGAHLGLVGNDAFIEDSTALGSNSALTGLAWIGVGALFALHDGASVSTTGALANHGQVVLDTNAGDGGSSLTVAGALTNSGDLGIGNTALSASDKVTAASLDNSGSIHLRGSGANQALLDVAGALTNTGTLDIGNAALSAAGTLSNSGSIVVGGSVTNPALLDVTTGVAGFGTAGTLTGFVEFNFNSAIEFASGQINTLAAGATLFLIGNNAFIEDSSALGSNSALAGLSNIEGAININEGASVSQKARSSMTETSISTSATATGDRA